MRFRPVSCQSVSIYLQCFSFLLQVWYGRQNTWVKNMALIIWHLFMLGISCLLLAWGAERFVQGALGVSTHCGMSPLLAGVILVGFTTSFPEMLVSFLAAYQGQAGLSLGNALGSYMTNIGLGIGGVAMYIPLRVHSQLLTRELPLLVVALFLGVLTLFDGQLTQRDGCLLLVGFVLFLGGLAYLVLQASQKKEENKWVETASQVSTMGFSRRMSWIYLLVGCAVLLVSSHWLVHHGVALARAWGVSDFMIGLTVIAFGTSLPEVAASIASAWKGEPDMAIGNVVGSNMLGILAVTAMPALFSPGPIARTVVLRDLPMMGLMTVILVTFLLPKNGVCDIGRVKGMVLLCVWLVYTGFVVCMPA